MRIAVFSTRPFDRESLAEANRRFHHDLVYFEERLSDRTAALAAGFPVVCPFVNDRVSADVLRALHAGGTRALCLRSAGFNHVDLAAAHALGMTVLRVPAYSPHAVAEHTVALILTLNRKIHRAHARVREHNFSLDGLQGFDLHGKTAGVVGAGKIGAIVARILGSGFGCRLLVHDVARNPELLALGAEYVPLDRLLAESDIVTLHCPLTPDTHHLIDGEALARMKPGAMLVNTSRGGVVDTVAVIRALKAGLLGSLALDVYEEEGDLFFKDLSDQVIHDEVFARLLTFPNVLVTAHQAFFTHEALANIADTTLQNAADVERGSPNPANAVTPALVATPAR